MFLSALLEVSEQVTDIVTWVSIGAIALLIVVLLFVCARGTKYSTHEIAYAAVCLSASFTLSFVKFSPVQYGGSVTLASFVPLLLYAYKYGPVKGLLAGVILGLFNFISGPYILTPLTFILDYILAFASIGVMGFVPMLKKLPRTAGLVLGTVAVFLVRFVFHLVSGFIYFAEGAVWVEFPAWATANAFIYSFLYQSAYIPADCLICALVLFALEKTKALEKLLALMNKNDSAS